MHLKIFVDDCCGREIEKHLAAEGAGRAYLSNLRENASRARERQTRARAVSFQMHRLFLPLDEEVSCRLMENGKMMLDIAHLIDRKCVERYQNKFVTTSAADARVPDAALGSMAALPFRSSAYAHGASAVAADGGGTGSGAVPVEAPAISIMEPVAALACKPLPGDAGSQKRLQHSAGAFSLVFVPQPASQREDPSSRKAPPHGLI